MLSVTIQNEQNVPLVIPGGRLDAINSAEFELALQPLIADAKYLIIDLSKCNYLSSAGIRVLLSSEKRLKAKGGRIFLTGLLPGVYHVIEIAGLHKVFHLSDSPGGARDEIEKIFSDTPGYSELTVGDLNFQFNSITRKRQVCLLWKDQGIAGYDELGISIGTGSPAGTQDEDVSVHGLFVTCGNCAGFIPNNQSLPPDFVIPQNPAKAGIFADQAFSFVNKPSGVVKLIKPSSIPLNNLVDAGNYLKERMNSVPSDVMILVIADRNTTAFSFSICLVVDSPLTGVLKKEGFNEMLELIPDYVPGKCLLGIRFQLNDIPDIRSGNPLPDILNNTLTYDNIINIEPIKPGDTVFDPVIWVIISDGLEDASTSRLKIETSGDLALEPHLTFLTRRLYTDSARVVITQMHGGYTAQTFQVTSYDREGRKMRPTVLKISNRALITRESERCRQYALPYIFNNSAMVLGTEFFGDTGALRYNFVGIGGEQSQLKWLTHYFHNWTTDRLEPLFDKVFRQILKPWYGQPVSETIYPFRDHDPTATFFPDIYKTAEEIFSVSTDDQFITIEETGQRIVNPYRFLKYEFARRRETAVEYYTSICHGDLNMQNILLDEDMNVYLIDFSETKPRSLISDFARLEAIFMIDNAPLETKADMVEYLNFINRFYDTSRLDEIPVNTYNGRHRNITDRNVSLTRKMREYAFTGSGGDRNMLPYYIALLEWVLPVICYTIPENHKRLSMIVSGILCEKVMDAD